MAYELFKIESIEKCDNGFVVSMKNGWDFSSIFPTPLTRRLVFKDREEFKKWLYDEVI